MSVQAQNGAWTVVSDIGQLKLPVNVARCPSDARKVYVYRTNVPVAGRAPYGVDDL